jgi:hypothetical protein
LEVGEVMFTFGAVVSAVSPMPVTRREMESPPALKLTFALTVMGAVGANGLSPPGSHPLRRE